MKQFNGHMIIQMNIYGKNGSAKVLNLVMPMLMKDWELQQNSWPNEELSGVLFAVKQNMEHAKDAQETL